MSQFGTKKEYNTFIGGLITEANPLTFPENASLDEANCVLHRDGSRQRRLGMDLEAGAVLRSATITATDAVTNVRWENAANDTANQFVVLQTGTTLRVFDAVPETTSANLLATLVVSSLSGTQPIQGDNIAGFLVLCDGTADPFYLSYDPTTLAFTVNTISMKIRDFFGVDDSLSVEEQPGSLTDAHNYNLLNQGWSTTNITAYKASVGSVYPANNQQWFVGKDTDDDFDPVLLKKTDFGSSPAPKGHFIIGAFDRSTSRTAESGVTVVADVELRRPSAVCSAFQRVFYAGVQSSVVSPTEFQPNYAGYVFFTRTIRAPRDFGLCYQEADPTSEVDSELVDTDGGYLNIPNCGKIHRLVPKGPAVLVFAEKGIWAITGDDGGFRGTSYQVSKVSDSGAIGPHSVVDIETGVLYWNRGGIYVAGPDDGGSLGTTNLTESTIQTLYNEIDFPVRANAVGSFDPVNRRVSWLYSELEGYDGTNFRNKFTTELVFDTTLRAFYINTFSEYESPSPYVAGVVEMPNFLLRQEGVRSRGETISKYLIVQFAEGGSSDAAVSFGYYRNTDFKDWVSFGGGISYLSFLETGWEIMGDTARMKQAPYIVCHFKQTELTVVEGDDGPEPDNPSSCLLQSRWDWSNHSVSGKWGGQFQVYRLHKPLVLGEVGSDIVYGHEVISSKSRLPGRGKALSLRFESEEGKDFLLYGWSIKYVGNTNV